MARNLGMDVQRAQAQLRELQSNLALLDAAAASASQAANASLNPMSYGVLPGQMIIAPWAIIGTQGAAAQVRAARSAADGLLGSLGADIEQQIFTSNTNSGIAPGAVCEVQDTNHKVRVAKEISHGIGVKGEAKGEKNGVTGTAEGEIFAGARNKGEAEAGFDETGFNGKAEIDALAGLYAQGKVEADAGIAKVGAEGEYMLGARYTGEAEAHVGPGGISAKVGAEAMAGAKAEGKITSEVMYASSELSGEAFAGARAEAKADGYIGPYGASAKAGVEAFAGASAEAGGKVEAFGVSSKGSVGVTAGIGVEAKAGADFNMEKVGVQAKLKVAIGVGVSIDVDISFSPKKLSEDIARLFGF